MTHDDGADDELPCWEMTFYITAPDTVADDLFERINDLACDCTDAFGRCVYCDEVHPVDEEDFPILCDKAKPCRCSVSGMHPVRTEAEELRLYGTDALENELARRYKEARSGTC